MSINGETMKKSSQTGAAALAVPPDQGAVRARGARCRYCDPAGAGRLSFARYFSRSFTILGAIIARQ